MFTSFWQAAAIWLVLVIAFLFIAFRAKGRFLRTMGSTAAIIASGVPALFLSWGLVGYLRGELGSIYYKEEPSLLYLGAKDWAAIGIPWVATLLGIWLLVRRSRRTAIVPGK